MSEFSATTEFRFGEIEEKIGYVFNNKELLKQAFTRSSYANENSFCEDSEVLEFIGDSIVGMMVVKCLSKRYEVNHPNESHEATLQALIESGYDFNVDDFRRYNIRHDFECVLDESELSDMKIELVQRSTLAASIDQLGLEGHLLMSKSDVEGKVQEQASVKEDLFESIVGAVAIDSGWEMNKLERLVSHMMQMNRTIEEGRLGEEDYEDSLSKWFENHGENLTFDEAPCICKNLQYGVKVNLGMSMLCRDEYGYGLTQSGARRMAAKRAMKFIRKIGERAEAILKAVGKPDRERAINQLQELYQKGLIPKPEYTFSQLGVSESGNPEWECCCVIDGCYDSGGGYVCSSKSEAKKQTAFEALNYLRGYDLLQIFIKHGEYKEINNGGESR